MEYPDDMPYPSTLLLGWNGRRPLHVLVARNGETRQCVIVTCYRPDKNGWSDDFTKRKET